MRRIKSLDEYASRKRFERETEEATPAQEARAGFAIRKEVNISAVRHAWHLVEAADASDKAAVRAALENLVTEAMQALAGFSGVQ
jgi:hypothetical protein